MGAGLSSTLYLGVTYCCCNAVGSVCNACLGTTAASSSGRKRSVLLLTLAILAAFSFQYQIGPSIVSQTGWIWKTYRAIPGMGKITYNSWYKPCEIYAPTEEPNEYNTKALGVCAGNSGVYRPMFISTLFFLGHAIASKLVPDLQKEVWPAKYTLFGFCLLFSILMPTNPIFGEFYLWFARICATVFVLFQQLILIDVAYNWNEDWVEKSNQADRVEYGSGVHWLRAIVASCVALYVGVLTAIIMLYKYFGNCAENNWIITLSLLGVLAMTIVQLSGREGSLLASGVMSLYVMYLAYEMLSKNPSPTCNPRLGKNDFWGIGIGLFLTTISLIWTGWSWTAEERISNIQSASTTNAVIASEPNSDNSDVDSVNLDVPFLNPADRTPTGAVVGASSNSNGEGAMVVGTEIWKLNIVLAFISCWVAMTLTGWGIIEQYDSNDEVNAANPTVSRVNMAMIGISQWLAIFLYMWTLMAPILFPDRDFS